MPSTFLKGKNFLISFPFAFYFWRWLILVALGTVIYYQTLGFDFVFDDDWFIATNIYIRDWAQVHNAFIKLPHTRLIGIYSFALNYQLNALNPWGYHLFNLLVHLIAVGLVWALSSLLLKITGYLPFKVQTTAPTKKNLKQDFSLGIYKEVPFLVALLFLVHPCQTQAVSYVTQRFESMATVFYLAAVYCYLLARITTETGRKIALFVGTVVLIILGIMTKEVAVTIPLMLLAAEWILLSKEDSTAEHRNRNWIWIFLAVAGLLIVLVFMKLVRTDLRIFFQTFDSESHDWDVLTPLRYLMTQMHVFLTFVRLLIFPVGQNIDYDYPMSIALWQPPWTWSGLCLIALISYLAVSLRKEKPLISFGLVWMLITFSINLAPRANVIFEHKLYLISFGFLIAALGTLVIYIRSRILLLTIVGLVAVVLSVLSFQRNQVWKNDVTLWEDTIQKSSHKKRVMANLGLAYTRAHRYDEALAVFNRFMTPIDLKSYLARGEIYYEIGQEDLALKDFNYVIAQDKNNADAYIRRAKVYKRLTAIDPAVADLDYAIKLEPDNERALLDRGVLRMSQGRPQEALRDLQQVLTIDPKNYGALVDCAGVYFVMKQYDLALAQLNKAILIGPKDFKAYRNRAFCFLAMGKSKEALQDIEYYLRSKPNDAQMQAKYVEVKSLLHLP